MKIRASFVSNSSSSSFIVLFNAKELPIPGEAGFTAEDLFDLIESKDNWAVEATRLVAKGLENVREHVKENSEWDGGESAKQLDAFYEKHKNDYPDAAEIDIAYSDRPIKKLLHMLCQNGGVQIMDK